MSWYLVRHGRPLIDRSRPAAEWPLDPAGFDDVWALRDRLPGAAAWYSSPEPKALQTAQLLTDGEVGVLPGLREQERAARWVADFDGTVRRAFANPDRPATTGWEPLATTAVRLREAVRPLLAVHAADNVVLVGHGTAWTVLLAELTGRPPDLDRWSGLALPDLWMVEEPVSPRGGAGPPTM